MKLNLFDLLQASMSDPDSPNILLTVHLSDLHQLVVDTIEATRERILPLYMDAEKERPLTRKEVAEQLGVCETTVFNMARAGKLRSLKILSPDCLASSHLRRRIKRHDDGPEKDIGVAVGFFLAGADGFLDFFALAKR